jgi:hypothetical protein
LQPDARIPLRFGDLADRRAEEALLIEGTALAPEGVAVARFSAAAQPFHPIGCACCTPRTGAMQALHRLHLDRARGHAPWFTAVLAVASETGRNAIHAALTSDPAIQAWFRTGP